MDRDKYNIGGEQFHRCDDQGTPDFLCETIHLAVLLYVRVSIECYSASYNRRGYTSLCLRLRESF
jgi:hypothetical protein